ncbi:MAG: hypothetical protein AAF790_11585 [Planctomycetota bacterium]
MSGPRPRLIALGASNLRRGFPELFAAARESAGGPVELLAALGHGRSYGRWSHVAGYSLPGISKCGLWGRLNALLPAPTTALVTDVGNDLLYGAGPAELLGWVARCVDRLKQAGARVVMTELPTAGLATLGPLRYRFFRTLFFPPCRLTRDELAARAFEVNDGLRQIATEHGARIYGLPGHWYGFDPIHVKRAVLPNAWRFFLQRGDEPAGGVDAVKATRGLGAAPITLRVSLQNAAPHRRRLFGVERQRQQPSRTLPCGSTIAVF